MNWLTRKEVDAAAKKSKKAAIACSVLHWEQILSATKKDFRRLSNEIHPMSGLLCALCVRHEYNCAVCSLGRDHSCKQGGSLYRIALRAYFKYMHGDIDIYEFRRKARPILNLLKTLH